MAANEQFLNIIKGKDQHAFSVEITENAKGEPSVSVKVRSDESVSAAALQALTEYKKIKEALSK